MFLAYDFEVFKNDWLVVIIDIEQGQENVIINDRDKLMQFHEENKNKIWVGYNSRHYDQYILKGIICDFNPKDINDFIITLGEPGWKFSSLLNKIPLMNFDVMLTGDGGLKSLEGYLGHDIKESNVAFDLDRALTEEEINETVKYCRHDVQETIQVFIRRKEEFDATFGLLKMFNLPLKEISKTHVQLTALILGARKQLRDDEFEITIPSNLKIEKYSEVVGWYKSKDNHKYRLDPTNPKSKKMTLELDVAGAPHVFAWGGAHGALTTFHEKGFFLNMDVASLYPYLMVNYDLLSRNIPEEGKERFEGILDKRLELKNAGKKKEQLPLKRAVNGTYGAMKYRFNPLYDPRQANNVCVHGQLFILDLIEKLESVSKIIQTNTDGILIQMPEGQDRREWGRRIRPICREWERRTGLKLEFDEYVEVYQKDVNNYVAIKSDGTYKAKGAYVKKLSELDYNLPIVNKALVDYMVKKIPIEQTINECTQLKEFQMICKISSKYERILHGEKELKEKCVRVFASLDERDGGLTKIHKETKGAAKMPGTPDHCFIVNENVNGVEVVPKLDRGFYIDMAQSRFNDFMGGGDK